MFTVPLGDGAEIRPLEPWQAKAFAAYHGELLDAQVWSLLASEYNLTSVTVTDPLR